MGADDLAAAALVMHDSPSQIEHVGRHDRRPLFKHAIEFASLTLILNVTPGGSLLSLVLLN